MNSQYNGSRSDRRNQPPQRVTNAARQMHNTSSHGSLRSYVPQPTGPQQPLYHAAPQGAGTNRNMGQGQRGFAVPAAQTPPPKKKGRTFLILLTTVLALAAIGGAVFAGIQISKDTAEKKKISDKVTPYDALYCPGVYVDGISLGGMTPEQAMNSVQSQINQRNDAWKVQLVYNGNVLADIDTEMLNMSVDQNQLMDLMNNAWLQGHSGTLAERYAQMEALEQTPYTVYTAQPDGDTGAIDTLLAGIKSSIDKPAQDAYVVMFDKTLAYPFVFAKEETGLSLDTEPLKTQLYQMVSTMSSGTVEIKPEVIVPQVLQADLEKHYQLRATATTRISTSSEEDRNNNIRRCFELISGYQLMPGKTFSFNKVVGERTIENGFFPAIEYVSDEHVVGIGGGACQASTTVYQAAVRAGLQITSRRPHSDSVSYAEYGMDATVFMGGKQIDLCFKNTTEDPIYITAEVVKDPTNKSRLLCKVNMYGRDLENVRYELTTEIVETLPSLLDPVYVKDKESAAKAKDGVIINSYRLTYTDNVLTDKTLLFTDTYKPKPEKIYDPSMAKN